MKNEYLASNEPGETLRPGTLLLETGTQGVYKETLGSFTIECPRCHWKGDYGSIGGEIRCEECKSWLPLKDQIITERKKKEDDKESV